ncbi:reverse transcriptase domain-containing protein [Tanacetum coccineum]
MVNDDGIHVDHIKIEAIKNWEAPKSPIEVRSFLGLAGYYWLFIMNFSKIAKSLTILTQKNKKYDWCNEHETEFQTLKDNLCNAPILAFLDGPKDLVVYCDASCQGLGCVPMQRGKVIAYASRQLKIHEKNYTHNDLELELFSDYDCEIRYHPGKANIVADALTEMLRGLDKHMERRSDGVLYYIDRIWVPLMGDVRTLIMDEAHKSSKCLTFSKVKAEHQKLSGLLQQPEIPEWKWERIAIDFITKLPRTTNFKKDGLARLYLNEIMARHGVPILIVFECDSHFMLPFWKSMQDALGTRLDMSMAYHPQTDSQSKHTILTLKDMLRACVIDFRGSWDIHLPLVEFSYNNNYHSSMRYAPFEALYGRKCRPPILWAEVGEGQLIRPEIVQETIEKISQIKDQLKAARDHQKSVVCFGMKVKLATRFVGPFEITKRISLVAYRLRIPQELSSIHDTFHMSNLKKCLADPTLHVPLEEIQVDAKLNFAEAPVEILEREIKKLKRSRIPIVKVRWNSKRGHKFTWERED